MSRFGLTFGELLLKLKAQKLVDIDQKLQYHLKLWGQCGAMKRLRQVAERPPKVFGTTRSCSHRQLLLLVKPMKKQNLCPHVVKNLSASQTTAVCNTAPDRSINNISSIATMSSSSFLGQSFDAERPPASRSFRRCGRPGIWALTFTPFSNVRLERWGTSRSVLGCGPGLGEFCSQSGSAPSVFF